MTNAKLKCGNKMKYLKSLQDIFCWKLAPKQVCFKFQRGSFKPNDTFACRSSIGATSCTVKRKKYISPVIKSAYFESIGLKKINCKLC